MNFTVTVIGGGPNFSGKTIKVAIPQSGSYYGWFDVEVKNIGTTTIQLTTSGVDLSPATLYIDTKPPTIGDILTPGSSVTKMFEFSVSSSASVETYTVKMWFVADGKTVEVYASLITYKEFAGLIDVYLLEKATQRVLGGPGQDTFSETKRDIHVTISGNVDKVMDGLVRLAKVVVSGYGIISGKLDVEKPSGFMVTIAILLTCTTDYPITLDEIGTWWLYLSGTATPQAGVVGGIIVPIDKFGLLAPRISLASTIIVATAATAIYVKRVKRRKEKQ